MYLLSTFNYKVRGGADLMVYLCFRYNAHRFLFFLLQCEINDDLHVKCVRDCSDLVGYTCNLLGHQFGAIRQGHFAYVWCDAGAICDVMLKSAAHFGTRAQSQQYCATEEAAACSSSGSTACLGKRHPVSQKI